MYGFRGSKYNVDLLSPFQMCMHWQCIEAKHPDYRCPETFKTVSHSQWTEAGKKFKKIQKEPGTRMPEYIPGDHYVVIDKPDHIILPNIPQLGNLPHVWMWCRRSRPYVPVWSYAKVPKSKLSPNENGRLLNVYMRPWTLNPATATADNVLLSEMAFCKEGEGERANDETKPETSPRRRELQRSLEVPINAEGHEQKEYRSLRSLRRRCNRERERQNQTRHITEETCSAGNTQCTEHRRGTRKQHTRTRRLA